MDRRPLQFTPFHVAGALFLLAGLVLAVYHGLEQFEIVARVSPFTGSWISWSHIHYVTIGGFAQLVIGMLPQMAARKLDRPLPPRWYTLTNFVGINGGLLLLWYGRGWGHYWAFDLGTYAIWLVVLGLFVAILRMALQSDGKGWDASVALFLLSPFIFLWGISYAYGLFAHAWTVPGGWLGLREAHVHANAWGFLAFAAIGTMYMLFPRIVNADLHSERLRDISVWFFALGIFPLITGPWLGMGRSITATGLVLYAVGFIMYVYNMVKTYQAGASSGLSLSMLVAQFWILGPAGFAPFVIFGVEWVDPAYIEQGALHWFFMGWALPIAFAGLLLFSRNLPCPNADADARAGLDLSDLLPANAIPSVISRWMVWAWNLAVLTVGFGFLYQTEAWSAYLFGVGWTVLAGLWFYYLVRIIQIRMAVRSGGRVPTVGGQ